jgi:DNA-binding MarR family transcriptional regulator
MHRLYANKLGAFGLLLSDALKGAFDDLSPSAAAMLLTLFHHPDMAGTMLAEIAGVVQPTAVRVLDGLAGRGLIERQARSGRTAPVHLTDAGRARAQSLQTARLDAMDRLLSVLPGTERGVFGRLLDTVLAGATASRTFARTTCRLCDHLTCAGPLCPIGTRATELERSAAI